MIENGLTMTARTSYVHPCTPFLHRRAALPVVRFAYVPKQLRISSSYRGTSSLHLSVAPSSHLFAASNPFLRGEQDGFPRAIPWFPKQRRHVTTPRSAFRDIIHSFSCPPAPTEKPRWWWRTLACLPYLMALHEAWFYAEMAYSPHPFQEGFEALTHPFLRAVGRLPSWFHMMSFTVAYLGIVKRKEWPHFFRFHAILGMLTEIALQVIGTASGLMPLNIFGGKIGMYYWIVVAFVFLVLGLECIRCALTGIYPDIPFLSEAAYFHTNVD